MMGKTSEQMSESLLGDGKPEAAARRETLGPGDASRAAPQAIRPHAPREHETHRRPFSIYPQNRLKLFKGIVADSGCGAVVRRGIRCFLPRWDAFGLARRCGP